METTDILGSQLTEQFVTDSSSQWEFYANERVLQVTMSTVRNKLTPHKHKLIVSFWAVQVAKVTSEIFCLQ